MATQYNPLDDVIDPSRDSAAAVTNAPASSTSQGYNPMDDVIDPNAGAGHTLGQSPPASKPATKPLTSTSWWSLGGNERGDPVPYSSSPEFPGVTPETMSQTGAAIRGAVTGDTSVLHPEIPALNLEGLGLSPTDPKAWGVLAGMATSRDPAALARIIQERVPNAAVTYDQTDRQGRPTPDANPIVQVPGGPTMYLDRPGLTPQKLAFYGPQTAAAVLSSGRSLPAQMGLGGLQHALSHLANYALGGAEYPVDPTGTALATVLPGVLGAGGAGVVKGLDWLSSEPATSAAEIAARARYLSDFGFAGKEGDITQNPGALTVEDLAANAGSDAARLHMQSFHDFNAAQNQINKRQIIGNVSGDVAPGDTVPSTYQPNESQFGDALNANITAKANQLSTAEKAAWSKLGDVSPDTAAGRSVSFSPDVSTDVLAQSGDTMRRFYGAPQGPGGTYTTAQLGDTGQAAVNAFGQLRRVMQPAAEDGTPGAIQGFNLGHLQDLRQQFGNVIKDKPGTSAAAAATQMKRSLDDAISNAEITQGRMNGDPGVLADFRAANAATRARYGFTEPRDNPAATSLITGVTNDAAPYTGQQTVNGVFGGTGGTVTPGGGTNAIVTHLQSHLGDDATDPLSGALAMRSLYGNKGTSELSEGPTARPQFDFNSTSDRIKTQLLGQGRNVSTQLLPPDAQQTLMSYARALDVLGTANRAGVPRLNAPGSGYMQMLTSELPFGLGRVIDKARSATAARNATQTGAEIMQRANAGATTPGGLGISLPRQSTLQNPANPFFSWQPGAWRAGTPLYRGGGLLGAEALQPTQQQP